MMVPLDDKAIARGYALKEEMQISDNKVFKVNFELFNNWSQVK